MNETLFRQIAEKDFDSLKALIEKGDFETSEFEFQVSRLATLLAFLSQAIGG